MVEKQNSKGKRILISIPRVMLEEMDALAKKEFRTRSELIREMFRAYKAQASQPPPKPTTVYPGPGPTFITDSGHAEPSYEGT